MWRTYWLLIALTAIGGGYLLAECIELPSQNFGRLEVLAMDLTGAPLPGATIALYATGVGERAVKTTDFGRVPYGRYRAKVEVMGFHTAWRDVVVGKERTVVRVPMELGEECGPRRPAISGRIAGARSGESLWVKAVPLRGTGGDETPVEANGAFRVLGLAAGDYLLLVLRGDAVLHQQAVRTYPSSDGPMDLMIDLAKR